jgi:hypothetical protein
MSTDLLRRAAEVSQRDLFAAAPHQRKPLREKPPSARIRAVFDRKIVRADPPAEFDDEIADVFPGPKVRRPSRRPQRARRRRSANFAERTSQVHARGLQRSADAI